MKVGLFIPCYIDQFYPKVGIASLELLEKLGCEVSYPLEQTCCGQPMANTGCEKDAIPTYHHYVQQFSSFDYIVAPSGSCTYHVRKHYDIIPQTDEVKHIREHTVDIVEFLVDILKIKKLDAAFPHKVGLHQSCHGLRGLRLGKSSELMMADFSKPKYLLQLVKDIELVELDKTDECCGFGGTFAIAQTALSAKMGKDRIKDHELADAAFITAGDMSCLMHLEGLIKRNHKNIQIKHLVEILNGS